MKCRIYLQHPVSVRFADSVRPDQCQSSKINVDQVNQKSQINANKEVRNLGVIIDRNLSFQSHAGLLFQRYSGMLLAVNHVKHVLLCATTKHLIAALVFSTMRYCMSVFGICGQTEKRRLQQVTNFAARILSGHRKYEHIAYVIPMFGGSLLSNSLRIIGYIYFSRHSTVAQWLLRAICHM